MTQYMVTPEPEPGCSSFEGMEVVSLSSTEAVSPWLRFRNDGIGTGVEFIHRPPSPHSSTRLGWRIAGGEPALSLWQRTWAVSRASGCFLSKHPQKKRRSMLPPSLVFAETGRGAWSGIKNGECGEWRTKSEGDGMKLYPKSTFTALGHWYHTGRAVGNGVLNQESTCRFGSEPRYPLAGYWRS
ncbi:hypothetical protein BD779DRAFT_1791628 [Infundibulicybe gibba]|nr:hypothetical protein BD779DRAFT_1791628 [Infundibulicybe gibba]